MKTNNRLREALEDTTGLLESIYEAFSKGTGGVYMSDAAESIAAARAALAEPLRNCDVGTAEEQAERFYKFCTEHSSAIHGMCAHNCPCIDSGGDKCHCLCKWAQMSYEEGGDHAEND